MAPAIMRTASHRRDAGQNTCRRGRPDALPLCRSAAPAPAGHSPERDDVWCRGWPGAGSAAARTARSG